MPIVPKFQTCKCGERVPTKFEIKGDEVEYPGIHVCPNGHALPTDLEVKPGADHRYLGPAELAAYGRTGLCLRARVGRRGPSSALSGASAYARPQNGQSLVRPVASQRAETPSTSPNSISAESDGVRTPASIRDM